MAKVRGEEGLSSRQAAPEMLRDLARKSKRREKALNVLADVVQMSLHNHAIEPKEESLLWELFWDSFVEKRR